MVASEARYSGTSANARGRPGRAAANLFSEDGSQAENGLVATVAGKKEATPNITGQTANRH